METKTKVLIAALATILVAVPLVTYAFAMPEYYTASTTQQPSLQTSNDSNRLSPSVRWFLKDAKNVTIHGTVITHNNNVLVVSSEGKRLNILLPRQWNVNDDNQVYNVSAVFDNDFIKVQDIITVNALQRSATNKNGVTVSIIVAYEITDGSNSLYAVLPFNINP